MRQAPSAGCRELENSGALGDGADQQVLLPVIHLTPRFAAARGDDRAQGPLEAVGFVKHLTHSHLRSNWHFVGTAYR